jgi:hypothetical protein
MASRCLSRSENKVFNVKVLIFGILFGFFYISGDLILPKDHAAADIIRTRHWLMKSYIISQEAALELLCAVFWPTRKSSHSTKLMQLVSTACKNCN